MKYVIILVLYIITGNISCSKKNSCTWVTITKSTAPCTLWGIKVNDQVYPSGNIPATYQQEGLVVCAEYTLYQDMRLCACCGGTWANISAIDK